MVDLVCHLLVPHTADHQLSMGLVIFDKEDMQGFPGKFGHRYP
jgi:hypothetical protein